MGKGRLEMFSDGGLAIIITIAAALYGIGVVLWVVPDRRIERRLTTPEVTERDQSIS